MALLFFFLWVMLPAVWQALPETDAWWMLPGFFSHLEGKSPLGVLVYLVHPGPPLFDIPSVKIHLWFCCSLLHLPLRAMILGSVLLHLCNAGLIHRVGRQMGLDPRASLCAAFVYFAFFASFHAYFWPPAAQHLLAVLTVLLIWSDYLSVEQGTPTRGPGGGGMGLRAFFWGVLGSLQRSCLIAPAMILTHLLFCSRDARQRLERYRRWLPLLIVYPVYPIVALSTVGDLVSITAIAKNPLPAGVKIMGLLALALSGLWVMAWALDRAVRRPSSTPTGRRWPPWVVWGMGATGLLALALRDSRQVLFFYNAAAPWLTAVSSFLNPIQHSLLPDSTDGYYILPPQITPFALLFSVLSLGIFFRRLASRRSPLTGLVAWYAVCLIFILFAKHIKTSFPPYIPSRYFIYLSPLVAWVSCASALWVYDRTLRRILPKAAAEILLAGGLAFLCAANLVAARLEIFRCRLVNTYLLYDDWKTVSLIRQDLEGRIGGKPMSPPSVSVEKVSPMLFSPRASKLLPVSAIPLFNFRWLEREAFKNRSGSPWLINSPAAPEARYRYRLEGGRVVDAQGRPIDRFSQWADRAFVELQKGNRQEAMDLLLRAVRERPFFLRTLLSSCRLSDLRWITQGRGLRDWLREIDTRYARWSIGPHEKREAIRAMVERETTDYLICLVAIASLHQEQNRLPESRAWLSQTRYLEDDPADLAVWIGSSPWVKGNPSVQLFLQKLQDPFYLEHPLPWRMDDYGFGRFLLRLLTGKDIQSGWEQIPGRVV